MKPIHYYLKALNIKPDYSAALNNLGEALAKKSDYDKAIYYFKRSAKNRIKKSRYAHESCKRIIFEGKSR